MEDGTREPPTTREKTQSPERHVTPTRDRNLVPRWKSSVEVDSVGPTNRPPKPRGGHHLPCRSATVWWLWLQCRKRRQEIGGRFEINQRSLGLQSKLIAPKHKTSRFLVQVQTQTPNFKRLRRTSRARAALGHPGAPTRWARLRRAVGCVCEFNCSSGVGGINKRTWQN